MLALFACACSRTASVEPVPLADRMRVTFPMGEGVEHEITDPTLLGRIQALVNADLSGWRDITGFGKDPIPHARLLVDAGGNISASRSASLGCSGTSGTRKSPRRARGSFSA